MSQLAYPFNQGVAFPGMIADTGPRSVESFAAQGNINFGLACVAGTDPVSQVAPVANDTDLFRGVAVHYHREINAPDIRNTEAVPVLRKGRIWVEVTAAVQADEPAFVNVAIAQDIGKFTNVAVDNLAVPRGFFRTDALPGGLAVLEINLP